MIAADQSDHIHSKAIPDLVNKLLAERQQVLVLFQDLVGLKPYDSMAKVQPILQQFCQTLVDYAAFGHFEMYVSLEDETGDDERCQRIKRLARELYPRIAATTQIAVDFNDRYDGEQCCENLAGLNTDLSRLGENLANRIELEDRLISSVRSFLKETVP